MTSLELFKTRIRPYLPKRFLQQALNINRNLFMAYGHASYSQCGQDIFLSEVFVKTLIEHRPGFYVDVGACHPIHNSNTYYFYRRGWNGICIEPMEVGSLFRRRRPRDTFIQAGASADYGEMTLHHFSSPYYNSFDEASITRAERDGVKFIRKNTVPTIPLADILARFRPEGDIDFMCIDVEGHELAVLRGNNWDKFRPSVICVEMVSTDMMSLMDKEVSQFLSKIGYHPFAKLHDDVFFRTKPT